MKKFLIFFTLILFNFSISFAENYLNLKSFNDLIYGKNILDIRCFDTVQGYAYIKHDRIDFNKKIVVIPNYKLPFDKSSSDLKINYMGNLLDSYSFYSLNLKTLILEEKYINKKDSKRLNIKKKIKNKKDAFKIFDSIEPTFTRSFECTEFWGFKLEDFGKKIHESILNEASSLSNKPRCKGTGILGPDDPSINWNNCVGFKKLNYGYYIGEFEDGYLEGQGIEFKRIGKTISQIFVGNFKEDSLDGLITGFHDVNTYDENIDDPNNRKSWKTTTKYIEGEIDSYIGITQLKTQR